MKGVTVLGSTGTIGVNTLDVIARHTDQYKIIALTAHRQVDRLVNQCERFKPRYAVIVDVSAADKLRTALKTTSPDTVVLQGAAALDEVASRDEVDIVMAAIVGAAGLNSTLAAARTGKRILLANKESLVMSGQLLMNEVKNNNAELLPIDSEHNAIFQCLPHDYVKGLREVGVDKILLTGSGGPFRELELERFSDITPEQAVAHPNWDMGKKISVDSATMMNKGLEIIEACWLFNTSIENIDVVIHPQSVVHSMVQYVDGSVLAQLGQPDMRTPIAHALAWPDRILSGVKNLDLFAVGRLDFCEVETDRYPCLELARQALKTGGTATTVLNAANEIAVQAFLDRRISFLGISETVDYVMNQCAVLPQDDLKIIISADLKARNLAEEYINGNKESKGMSVS